MNFVYLVDDPLTFDLKKDTSYILMQGSQQLGHNNFIVLRGGISIKLGEVYFEAVETVIDANAEQPFQFGARRKLRYDEFQVVMVRTDPPFHEAYLHDMWLLDIIADKIAIVNHPRGIMAVNEKIFINRFADLVPPTLITRDQKQYRLFLQEQKKIVLKPTDGFGGSNVFIVEDGEPNANVIFENLIGKDRYVIAQKYLEQSSAGDKRIHILGGHFLGALERRHSIDDFRNNLARGAKAFQTTVSVQEQKIIDRLKPTLLELGLHYVGIDTIGDYLIELNVTSPTTVQELNSLYGKEFHLEIIRYCENLAKKNR